MQAIYTLILSLVVFMTHVASIHSPAERCLKAAQPKGSVAARSERDLLQKRFDLHYLDDQPWRHTAMGAKLELQSQSHSLVLEHIEHFLEEVECTPDASLAIRFRPEYFRVAHNAIANSPNLLIITSHAGCNQAGARMPYRAANYSSHEDELMLKFVLKGASWKDDFGIKVRFGPADRHTYVHNRHDHLAPLSKRGIDSFGGIAAASLQPSLSSATVSSTSTLPAQSSILFPQPTGQINQSQTNVTDSVAFSLQKTQLIPPSLDNITLGIPFQDTGLTITCTECRATGSVSLTSGYFSSGANSTGHFLREGFVELAANDLSAHIELDVHWLATEGESFPITLGKIPLDPFIIPGVANVGATFMPQILLSVSTPADVDFTYGFDVKVPYNSTALASFGNASSSTVTGFAGTAISALPFNAQVNNVSLTLSATLRAQILLGLTVLEENAGAAVFLSMPQLSISVTEVTNTNERCEPRNTTADASQVNKMLGNLTHVVPQAELAAGFVIAASGVGQTAYTPFATTFGLETACLAYKTQLSSYVPATAAFASATATSASAAASKTTSPGTRLRVGFEGGGKGAVAQWQWALIALAIVFGTFATF